MIVVVNMKNVIQQGDTYHFRITVPKDCVKALGKKEIVESLRTKKRVEAEVRAEPLRAKWKKTFKEVRGQAPSTSTTSAPDSDASAGNEYECNYQALMLRKLPEILEHSTDEQLSKFAERCWYTAHTVRQDPSQLSIPLPELDLTWPPSELSPGQARKRNRALGKMLLEVVATVEQELERPIEIQDAVRDAVEFRDVAKGFLNKETSTRPQGSAQVAGSATGEETDLLKVAELLIQSKKRVEETNSKIRAEVRHLKEWTKNKSDITKYTKADLIDYVQNCLPHMPPNIHRNKAYKGKSLRKCVALTKKDPETHPPIAHKTCENTLMRLQMVFNYAKNDLGVIPVNPAKGVEIPKNGASKEKPKGYTAKERKALWAALKSVHQEVDEKPARYWVPILCLYHGFRLDEPCSLFLKDVYEDDDGIWVMDLNEDEIGKSLKSKSSFRLVPVHPYVLNDLGFKAFVETQKKERREGLLFSDLVLQSCGYRGRISRWYPPWRKTWLSEDSHYKHSHHLRHTFIQQAQNQAKMSDRCSQEITGHAIEGVSSVHLEYSGRLKPKAVLEELEKLKYGWEDASVD